MAPTNSPAPALKPIDSLIAEVITDDVSDTYVSKTLFAVSEFANVVLAGAKIISGEALLCANLGFGLKLVSGGRAGRGDLHPQLRQPRNSLGLRRMHCGQPRTLGSHGRASARRRGYRERRR